MKGISPTIKASSGFTLIEIVVVIVLVGIIAPIGAMLVSRPVEQYIAMARRAELVDSAEMVLRRMQRDIRNALPNSIRVPTSGGRAYLDLEFLNTVDGGRYREALDDSDVDVEDILDFSAADTSFDVLGDLNQVPSTGDWVVVANLTSTGPGANAYVGDNRTAVAAGSAVDNVEMSSIQFPFPSVTQRFFIVDQPVTYACNPAANGGTLTRFDGYAINVNQPSSGSLGGGALVSDKVTACSFTYDAGTDNWGGLVTLSLTLAEAGEQVTLIHQMHVVNAP